MCVALGAYLCVWVCDIAYIIYRLPTILPTISYTNLCYIPIGYHSVTDVI